MVSGLKNHRNAFVAGPTRGDYSAPPNPFQCWIYGQGKGRNEAWSLPHIILCPLLFVNVPITTQYRLESVALVN